MDKTKGIDKAGDLHVTGAAMTIFCKLFSDTIIRHLCDLRRRELNARGIFSCEGCGALINVPDSKKACDPISFLSSSVSKSTFSDE